MSWRFAPVRLAASGTPRSSTSRWCLLPDLARSTGLLPVFSPPWPALTLELSTTARSHDSRPSACNSERMSCHSLRQTPARATQAVGGGRCGPRGSRSSPGGASTAPRSSRRRRCRSSPAARRPASSRRAERCASSSASSAAAQYAATVDRRGSSRTYGLPLRLTRPSILFVFGFTDL